MPTELPLLALFHARLGDSRLAEFEAVWTRMAPSEVDWCWDDRPLALHGGDVGPRVVQWLPRLPQSHHGWLADTAARCVACRGVFEVLGQGDTLEECAAAANRIPAAQIRARVRGSWRVESVVLGARRSRLAMDLGARMALFGPVLDALEDRKVALKAPEHRLWLVEDRQHLRGDSHRISDPPPRHLLLYELVASRPPARMWLQELALSKRAFLSTSTLAVDRALMLCNLALSGAPDEGGTLLDPYCGSGGILLAAAALGAQTVGSDLDWRLVSDNPWPVRIPASVDRPQRGVEAVRMRDNFDEAGLVPPRALLALDVGAEEAAACLRGANGGRDYDALVCDPPYGRREFQHGDRAWRGELAFKVSEAALASTLDNLIRLAADTLRSGGRLVFLVPVRAPKDATKPTPAALELLLREQGARWGLELIHLGVEVVHGGLHRAVVVMSRGNDGPPAV